MEVGTSAKAESAIHDDNELAKIVVDVEAYALQNSAIKSDAERTDHSDEEEMLLDDLLHKGKTVRPLDPKSSGLKELFILK
uniref:Uncharacterized protein n=1 Tax=Romanomermis culicivorax TaxID=13658 RepID=A0A915I7S9_ROMCU